MSYRSSHQSVTINLANPAGSVRLDIYAALEVDDQLQKTGDVVRSLSGTEQFSLRKGTYVIVPSGDSVETAPITLTVQDVPVQQTVDVPYNTQYLAQKLASEAPAINTAIQAAYPNLTKIYSVKVGKLFGRGEWYGATLINKQGPLVNVNGDTLRILVHKSDNQWKVVSKPPTIILTMPAFSDTPADILRQVNQL